MPDCASCNRLNAVKCYCYFNMRQDYFEYVSGLFFSAEAFVIYAVDNNLLWKTKLHCPFKAYNEFMDYWWLLKPILVTIYSK